MYDFKQVMGALFPYLIEIRQCASNSSLVNSLLQGLKELFIDLVKELFGLQFRVEHDALGALIVFAVGVESDFQSSSGSFVSVQVVFEFCRVSRIYILDSLLNMPTEASPATVLDLKDVRCVFVAHDLCHV